MENSYEGFPLGSDSNEGPRILGGIGIPSIPFTSDEFAFLSLHFSNPQNFSSLFWEWHKKKKKKNGESIK